MSKIKIKADRILTNYLRTNLTDVNSSKVSHCSSCSSSISSINGLCVLKSFRFTIIYALLKVIRFKYL